MQVAEYVVDELIKYGVTDTFGIPGGVILRLLYAMQDRQPKLTPHLTYHEQTAGFAACGYAQASGKIGVAYATRGPGFTNMITCIAEAYQESLPVLFITAHGARPERGLRFENNQELDAVSMVSGITKLAVNVDDVSEVPRILNKAYTEAMRGRRGPVLLDFNSYLWMKDVNEPESFAIPYEQVQCNTDEIIKTIVEKISIAKYPIILIGDGIRHIICKEELFNIVEKLKIPVLSSRGAQDLLSGSPYYFGYIGSHGTRYSNFILSKTDLIVTIGNRLAFPVESESFAPIVKNAQVIRIDIDEKEFIREIPEAINYVADAKEILKRLRTLETVHFDTSGWIEVCNRLQKELEECDVTEPVEKLVNYIKADDCVDVFVCDIGNNEFWFSRAFEKCHKKGTILCSKAYGTLGAGLGRTIGAYYALKQPICCVIGDQGFQYNIQELAFIKQWNLPIKIVLLNNNISGMIKDHEMKMFGDRLVHVNSDNGYATPDFIKIIESYGLSVIKEREEIKHKEAFIYEIKISSDVGLTPNLPQGRTCQDMEPRIEQSLYETLNKL